MVKAGFLVILNNKPSRHYIVLLLKKAKAGLFSIQKQYRIELFKVIWQLLLKDILQHNHPDKLDLKNNFSTLKSTSHLQLNFGHEPFWIPQ